MAATATFRIFGDLEREIMTILWHDGQATVRDVYRQLTPVREIAYTTVMTTMTRLTEKGLLQQERRGLTNEPRGFLYRPVMTRSELMQFAVRRMWDELSAPDAERWQLLTVLHG